MKIVLVEMRGQQEQGERTFRQPVIKVGRDPATCDVVFDQEAWPMVSRRHGEIRWNNTRYLLVDSNSRYGTFLNGKRIAEPTLIEDGAHIQFGTDGPVLRVVRIEGDAKTQRHEGIEARGYLEKKETTVLLPPERLPGPASQGVVSLPETPSPPASPAVPSIPVFIEFTNNPESKIARIEFHGKAMLLGRDPASDVLIDAAAAVVSRRHAEIRRGDDQFSLVDLGSFNGTLLNNQRITAPTPLYDGDLIQLGMGGPVLCFRDAAHPGPPAEEDHVGARATSEARAQPASSASPSSASSASVNGASIQRTMRTGGRSAQQPRPTASGAQAQLVMQFAFKDKPEVSIGRAPDNDIRLDGLQISCHHARFAKEARSVAVEDRGSTNGVYVNGERISSRRSLQSGDIVQIGPFVLQADVERGVAVFDPRSKTRIDAIDITKAVPDRSGRGYVKLLDDIDLVIQPNEFVGLLGPSGAGKSTLMDALNGMRPASDGQVLINNLDLYQHLDSLKQSIGYVPQDDIIHRELTIYRTLFYVARLRLSRDVSREELDQIVNEVLDVTGLAERRNAPVAQLSGGQRKRVSIAVELITKPSIIFLDEPTSGLDPATEEKIMKLFRQIAESGRTVILTTHAMENVHLFDKIVVMMRGRLVFYGTPAEALAHTGAANFKELYDKLEAPIEAELSRLPSPPQGATPEQKRLQAESQERITEGVAEEWRRRFHGTETYRRNIAQPIEGLNPAQQSTTIVRHRSTFTDMVRQWATFTRRYLEVLGRDRFNLLILFGQAPVIALLTYLVVSDKAPRDFPYFMLALVAVWFGASVAAREIVKEQAVYNRERMVNLRLLPYVWSKIFVLSLIVSLQCILLFGTLKILHYANLLYLPGLYGGLPQLLVMILTGMVGIALGLFISAVVKTSEMATSLIPLILIPQILFSGLIGMPAGAAKFVGAAMPATWSFDEMKRLSTLDALNEEGSIPTYMKEKNREEVQKAQTSINDYRGRAAESIEEYERRMRQYLIDVRTNPGLEPPRAPTLDPAPSVSGEREISEDLKDFVSFTHPWGGVVANPLILFLMLLGLTGATVTALRAKDTG